jgi:hypothetical protein
MSFAAHQQTGRSVTALVATTATTTAAAAAAAAVGAAETAATTTAAATATAAEAAATTTAAAEATAAAAFATAATTAEATTAAAAAFTTGTAVGATETARALFTRTSLVHNHSTTTDGLTIQAVDCGLGFRIRSHFDKAETLRTAGFPIHHHLGGADCTVSREGLVQIFITHTVGQIAYVKLISHGESAFLTFPKLTTDHVEVLKPELIPQKREGTAFPNTRLSL